MRNLTIGRMSRRVPRPLIRIQGLWLSRLGWEAGDKIEVSEDRSEILIRKRCIHDPGYSQLKLPHIEDTGSVASPPTGNSSDHLL